MYVLFCSINSHPPTLVCQPQTIWESGCRLNPHQSHNSTSSSPTTTAILYYPVASAQAMVPTEMPSSRKDCCGSRGTSSSLGGRRGSSYSQRSTFTVSRRDRPGSQKWADLFSRYLLRLLRKYSLLLALLD